MQQLLIQGRLFLWGWHSKPIFYLSDRKPIHLWFIWLIKLASVFFPLEKIKSLNKIAVFHSSMDCLLVVFVSSVERFGQNTSIFTGLKQEQPLPNTFKFKGHASKQIWLFWHRNRSFQQWSIRHTDELHFSHEIVHRVKFVFVNICISATSYFITLIPLSHPLASLKHPEPNRWATVTATRGSCSCASVSTRGNE